MSAPNSIIIELDDRIRLMSAALAGTNYPETAQSRKRHHAHAHARATRKVLADKDLLQHPAVLSLQQLLDQGAPMEAAFTLVMQLQWPGLVSPALPRWVPADWPAQLMDLYEKADLAGFWTETASIWEAAKMQSETAFASVQFKEFLAPFLGDIEEELVFIPNICYPADTEVGIRAGNRLIAICPPPQAWGDSPPWPYDDESMLTTTYRAALTQYGRLLLLAYLRNHAEKVAEATRKSLPVSEQFQAMNPSWEEQFIALFTAAAVAIYLEDFVNAAEARAYVLFEKKARGMSILPGTISVLRRYLQERGNRYSSLAEFLPVFPTQLRVAKKIVTL